MRKTKTKSTSAKKYFLTNTGQLVTEAVMKSYEVSLSPAVSGQSKDSIEEFKKNQCKEPPYNLVKLMQWIYVSVWHSVAIKTKLHDIVGCGYVIKSRDEAIKVSDYIKDKSYNQIVKFLDHCNPSENLTSVLKKVYRYFDGCGNGFIEVTRDPKGIINGLFNLPSLSCRYTQDEQFLIQLDSLQKKTYFKKFGDDRLIDIRTGQVMTGTIVPERLAREFIPVAQFSHLSSCYGVPDWYPGIIAMLGDLKSAEFNLDFFVNFGIPAYAVFFEGGDLGEEEEEGILEFFKTRMRGSANRVLTMGLPSGCKVTFEKLGIERKEASFVIFAEGNRDLILSAHRVPPYRAMVVKQGQLGGSAGEETDSIYFDSVVRPAQDQFEWIINELVIRAGMGIEDWYIEFKNSSISDEKKRNDMDILRLQNGLKTPNQIRQESGDDPYIGGDYYYMPYSNSPIGISQEGIDSKRAVKDELEKNEETDPEAHEDIATNEEKPEETK